MDPVPTGFVALSAAEQASLDETQTLTLEFTDFDPGETFFFTTDLDDTFGYRVSGREFAYATVTATFIGPGLGVGGVTLSAAYFGDPDNLWRAVTRIDSSVQAVPLPAGFWLLVSGLAAIAVRRR